MAGKSFVRSGKVSYHFLEEEAKEKNVSIYDIRRDAVAIISFGDSHRAFNNKERYYQQRFNAFDNEDISVLEYLIELGYDPEDKSHQSIIDKCGITPWLDLSRIKLSSGQSRKLLISTAILKQPKLLIIDNPHIGLDEKNRKIFNDLIDELAYEKNIKIILSGHLHSWPSCITHELNISNNGNLSIKKPKASMKQSEPKPDVKSLDIIKDYFTTSHHPVIDHAVKLEHVTIAYKDSTILVDINWNVKLGEKWALFGPNGSGKSTLLGMIAADHPKVYANKVFLFDKQRGRQDSIWDIKKHIGFISSEMHAYFNYDVQRSATEIILDGLFTSIYSRPPITDQQIQSLSALLSYFEIEDLRGRTFLSLSTGEQRLVLILRALIKNPPLLLLDEPFQGLDVSSVIKFKHLLNYVLTDKHTLIFITHYAHEVPACVGHTFYLEAGKRVNRPA